MVYNWQSFFHDSVISRLTRACWPIDCGLCQAPDPSGRGLCRACQQDLQPAVPLCPVCAQPLSTHARLCGRCLRRPPPFCRTHCLFLYAPPVDRLILQLKFNGALQHARLLAQLFSERLEQQPRPELLIPVPLHPRRQRQRGFNQCVEIARPLAAALDMRLDLRSCVRMRHSPPQAQLPARARRRNLRAAFALRQPIAARRVALLDDVMTTGSTVAALATLLRKAGVEEVEVWVCARTLTRT